MKFLDFIKNPAQFIWGKPSDNLNVSQSNQDTPHTQPLVNQKDDLTNAFKNKDWLWLLRGKTGLFLKISIPLILILLIINGIVSRPDQQVINDPNVVDQGDKLESPKFESVNYIAASPINSTALFYSPKVNKINEIGVRGVVLSSVETDEQLNYYFPINLTDYLYIRDNKLFLHYRFEEVIRKSGRDEVVVTEKEVELLPNILSSSLLVHVHKTQDNFLALTYKDTFYVFDLRGNIVEQFKILDNQNTYLYTYFNGEIYYVKKSGENLSQASSQVVNQTLPNYSLERLNKNKEVIYSQNFSNKKVHNMYILNDDRYLLVFEDPTDTSFFFIQMKDSEQRTVFGFIPQEEVQKQVKIDYVYFLPENNTVLTVGSGIAKLYTNTGKQLWLN